jgi:acyl dehydratase
MIPLSGDDAAIDRRDDLDAIGTSPTQQDLVAGLSGWRLDAFGDKSPGPRFADLSVGDRWLIDGRDVVSSAPELARLTGNVASVHHDAAAAGGQRLVYGGHTIGLALHQATRALPSMVTVAGWHSCDHVGPVHENDALGATVEVTGLDPLVNGGGLVALRVLLDARDSAGDTRPVLDWRPVAVLP